MLLVSQWTTQVATAAPSDAVNFQARLQNSDGAIVADGNYNVEFKLYDASSGGTLLWTEDYTSTSGSGGTDARIQVADGYLSTALGSINPFPSTIDWSQQLYLTMNIGGTGTGVKGPSTTFPTGWDSEMNPRLALTATPYSFLSQRALTADTADQIATSNSNGTSTLSIQGPGTGETGSTFILQDEAAGGTFYLLTSDTSGNVNVSGLATAANINTGSVDRANAGTLSIGSTNATALALGSTTANIGTTINGTAVVKTTSGNTSGAFQVQNANSDDLFDVDTDTSTVNIGATGSTDLASVVNIATTSSAQVQTVTIGDSASNSVTTIRSNGITQTITGKVSDSTDIVKGDSSGLFQVQSGGSVVPVLGVDTADGRVGVNTGSPAYALDVNGVINSNTSVDVNGVAVCTTSCIPSSGSGNYVQNGATVQTDANFFIRGIGGTTPTGQIQGASGQSGDLLDIETWDGSSSTTVDKLDSSGSLTINTAATDALHVVNGSGGGVFNVDTTNQQLTASQDSSAVTAPILSLAQGGSGDSTLALQNSLSTSAFYVSNDASNGDAFTINSYTAATTTTTTTTATPAIVQSMLGANTAAGTSLSLAFSSNNTAGNAIIVGAGWSDSTATPTCSDTQGNAYSAMQQIVTDTTAGSTSQQGVCYATNIKAGADTVTVTYGSAMEFRYLAIHEYSGIATSSPVDAAAKNHATGTTGTDGYTSTAATTTINGDLIFGFFSDFSGTGATAMAGTDFTQRINDNTAFDSPILTEDKVQATAGSVAATMTDNQADPYAGITMAFKPAVTVTTGSGPLTDTNANALFSMSQSGQANFRNVSDSTTAFRIQNASGSSLFTADTSGMVITIGGASGFATLNLDNAHFESTQSTAPTISTPSSCGTSPTSGITTGSTDAAGAFYINSGGTTAANCSVVITFNKSYAATPKSIVISPDNTLGGTAPATLILPTVSAKGTTSFTVQLVPTDIASRRYGFDYWVVE